MEILTMGTTRRHMKILDVFTAFFVNKQEEEPDLQTAREQIALVENGRELIDLSELTVLGLQEVKNKMGELDHTYPDFMIFKENPVLMNNTESRYAGIPDLIIEVWSKTNHESEREQKRALYCTNKSEFWEIEQNSPIINCWNKEGQMYQQQMDAEVKTPWGELINLTSLAKDVADVPNDRFHGGSSTGKKIDLSKFKK